jgi:hypothetical protein
MEQHHMDAIKTTYLASAIALLAAGLTAAPAQASSDVKALSGVRCQALGPNTVDTELKYNHNGIYNPGTGVEWVTCELPMDSESGWAATPSNSGYVNVYYSAGSSAGRVACTLYVGSSQMQTTPLYSATSAPATSPANTRTWLTLNLSYPSTSSTFTLVPATVECMITPKATLAGMYFRENLLTDTP